MKLTFEEVKPLVARVLGICEDDDKVAEYTNEAARRLLTRGMFAGGYGRFTIAVTDGCITLPRQIESIITAASCCGQVTVRNQWYEFNDGGYGLMDKDRGVTGQLVDRGTVPTYRDMSGGTNSYIRVYVGHSSDVGKTVTLQGYDQNGQWIRTQSGGAWIDGEKLTLASPYVQSTKKFTSLTGVIRDKTNTVQRVYEFNATDSTELDLAVYDPDETLPQYRRMFWSGLCGQSETRYLTVMARMRFINVANDNDYLIPPCPDAIKLMVKAIDFEEKNLVNESLAYEQKALNELLNATRAYLGEAVGTMRRVGNDLYGGGIQHLI